MRISEDIKGRTSVFGAALLLCMLCAAGCTDRSPGFQPHAFPVPAVPAMITSMEDAAEYLALNYWDDFTDTSRLYPCDSSIVNGVRKTEVEQAVAEWISILGQVPSGSAEEAVGRLFDRVSACEAKDTSSNVFEMMSAMVGKYLYDPNSPMRNEDLYLPFVTGLASYPGFTQEQREAYGYDARMCALNRTGTPAADFEFCDRSGRTRTLYSLKADFTLLFFSNPGCEACKYIMEELESDPALGSLISSGRLAVANIYIDEDIRSWYGYQGIYPDEWYNGYDPNSVIRTDLLYNVRAIPSLYLLDRSKNVILKDATDARVLACLHDIAEQTGPDRKGPEPNGL